MAGQNGALVTRNRQGGRVASSLYITSFSTGINLEFTSIQTQLGAVHRPNHQLSERNIEFECVWGVRQWAEVEAVSDRIREHHLYCLGDGIPPPMEFRYNGINRVYYGFIENADRGDERHKATYRKSFRLRLINPSHPRSAKLITREPLPFVPNAGDVLNSEDWYRFDSPLKRPTFGPGSKRYAGMRAI
jgi:hypothetical protein